MDEKKETKIAIHKGHKVYEVWYKDSDFLYFLENIVIDFSKYELSQSEISSLTNRKIPKKR